MTNYRSSILSSSLGNILEWYDFGLFTIFSSLFSELFFPNSNPHTALIATISIFSIGFFCRPLGAFLFGYLGDRYGRAKTLRLSILMIFLPTLFIGCLPTYEQIGIAAPVLLMLIRMWQGISIGGEYSGNLIYLAETAPALYRATFTSFASMGSNIGILLASIVGIITTDLVSLHFLQTWGWRIPYLISGLFCLTIFIFRLRIKETSVFLSLKNHQLIAADPIKTAIKNNFPEILRTLGLVCMGSTFYYFCFVYLPIFLASQLMFPIKPVSVLISILISLMILLVPLAGYLCDKIGRRKMLLFNSTLITLIVIPGFYLLQLNGFVVLLGVLASFTLASSLEQGTTPIAIVENFPPTARYTGISLGYNLGNGILGGTVPLICAWLFDKTGMPLSPAIYIAICASITGCVVLFTVPETKNKSLMN